MQIKVGLLLLAAIVQCINGQFQKGKNRSRDCSRTAFASIFSELGRVITKLHKKV